MTTTAATQASANAIQTSGAQPDVAPGLLDLLDTRLRWLSSWMIHNANHIRESRDGVKVGGHQASCASLSTILSTLYATCLRPQDKVAVKPHAGPLLHALHYLLGNQTLEKMQAFRGLGGVQSYPSRTKDIIPVDFSTGSVGNGVAITAFASLVQDYLIAHGHMQPADAGRMIALMGDAELDEGNIWECVIEAYKHDIRNCWWIVDYNRQSLDSTTADRMFRRFDDMFETCGWRVVTLKHGMKQEETFARPGGSQLEYWIDHCPNAEYSALTYQGGAAWRERLHTDLADHPETLALVDSFDDDGLQHLMTNLGGHCTETLARAFADAANADDDHPVLFIAYTVKGYGLPLAGHKDNHAGQMTTNQIEGLRASLGIAEGEEWEKWAGLGDNARASLEALLAKMQLSVACDDEAPIPVPAIAAPEGREQSTQMAFGRILLELSREDGPLAKRIVTTSPDVTVSTNLGPWVNQRGLFRRQEMADVFREAKIPSVQKWGAHTTGQHVELGIAEANLFLVLGAFGLANPLFGTRILPVGTIYDPFIERGLDQLNYACYQDARFMLVATPSGVTLGPEGGAHQSIKAPLITMGQAGLISYEPAFADELALIMEWGFGHMQKPEGCSVALRLSTRSIPQVHRADDAWRDGTLAGGYWVHKPKGTQAIAYMGALAPEAIEAWAAMAEKYPGLGLLAITSPDRLHFDWSAAENARDAGDLDTQSHIEKLLAPLGRDGRLITLVDGSPSALSWLGAVHGQKVRPLGVDRFGQTGDLPDLYREYGLDADAIRRAARNLFR